MATPGHRHSGSTASLSGRRPAIIGDAFMLKLPQAVPKLVLPPTPTSPDGGKDQDYATLSWRPRTPPSPERPIKNRELPPTPPRSDDGSLPPSSPPSLIFETDLPPPVPVKAAPAPPDNSYNGIINRGYKLHSAFTEGYEVLQELGSGGYGVVVRARQRYDGTEVAIKLMWSHKIPTENWIRVPGWDERMPQQAYKVPREAQILRNVKHAGIVSFIDLFEDDNFVYLIMEYFGSPWTASAPTPLQSAKLVRTAAAIKQIRKVVRPPAPPRKGSLPLMQPPSRPDFVRRSSCDLFECLEQHDFMPEAIARGIFRQIVDIVAYLHEQGIVHCDLKDENIVIDANYRVKLIDFGSAVQLDTKLPVPFQTNFRGTINYAPPCVLRNLAFQAPQTEIWALGCVLSLLLTGKSPFSGPDAILRGQISEPAVPMSRGAWDLMLWCLRLDPAERASIWQIQHHPWLREEY